MALPFFGTEGARYGTCIAPFLSQAAGKAARGHVLLGLALGLAMTRPIES